MKSTIQSLARELGFDGCRITSAQAPETAGHFQRWLASGCHGEMQYLARNALKRVDPQLVLPRARSIVSLAAAYSADPPSGLSTKAPLNPGPAPPGLGPETGGGGAPVEGLVARYARHADYHEVLGRRLQTLTTKIHEHAPGDGRSLWYVDTGPLLERDLAQRAGIGFIGKHTNLVSRQLGNWFFLAEIITTLELEPDPPEHNRCGSCTRCLSACPTQAITAPFRLDARRCISYLTIELKGSIPAEFRPGIGQRIYGCDDCLAVCPWNRFAREGQILRQHVRTDLVSPDLLGLLALSETTFKQRFAGTPILRTKRRGFLRNVCVALGNAGDSRALPALQAATSDPEPLIAEHARWAMERIEERRLELEP